MRDRYVNEYLAQQPSIATVHLPGNAEHKEIPVQRFTLITRLYLKVLQSLLEQVSLMVLSDSISDCTTVGGNNYLFFELSLSITSLS